MPRTVTAKAVGYEDHGGLREAWQFFPGDSPVPVMEFCQKRNRVMTMSKAASSRRPNRNGSLRGRNHTTEVNVHAESVSSATEYYPLLFSLAPLPSLQPGL
jgi:hypothetical protein